MKRITVLFFITSFICMACAVQKNKITYNFPATMPAHVQADYRRQCDKGKILYDINCAKCHSPLVRGKSSIPDFTSQQLVGYELRIQNPRHESAIPETTVTAEELGYIITFLTYKKKNS